MKNYLIPILALTAILTSCSPRVMQPTVTKLDPVKYSGKWHEIGRLPNRFENNVVAAKASYSRQKLDPKNTLSLLNEGLKKNGKRTSITGKVTQPDPIRPGKLKVRFDEFPANLFAGDYWVLGLSQDYTRALVGSPNRKYLWFLSKREKSTKANFKDFLKTAEKLGYDTKSIEWNPKRLP